MDSNCSESKILYFWDEYNIFIYIIPALLFFLLLSPLLGSFIAGESGLVKVVEKIAEIILKTKSSWPLVLAYLFVFSCILYIVGNVIASLSTFILGKVVSVGSIGHPDMVALDGLDMTSSAIRLRRLVFAGDSFLLVMSILLIFTFKEVIIVMFIVLCILIVILIVFYILTNVEKEQNKSKETNKSNVKKRFIDKCLEKILGELPREVGVVFKKTFSSIFNMKEQKKVEGYLPLARIYIHNNYPSVFSQIKRYHMLYSFSQNVAGCVLFALLFYMFFYMLSDLSASESLIIRWWGIVVWSMGNIFLARYLRTYYNTYYRYIIKAFVAVQSGKEKK